MGHLHVTDRPGDAPPLILLHGFPDDSKAYDRIGPLLAPHRVVAVDWLGYGQSEPSAVADFAASHHQHQLMAVLDALNIGQATLVAHDASGPDAIDFAASQPKRVDHLVLLNTYYGHARTLRFPEMIRLLADPAFKPLANAMLDDTNQRLWLVMHTARMFGLDPDDPDGVGVALIKEAVTKSRLSSATGSGRHAAPQ